MTTTDYLINIGLVALVILEIRGSRLDLKTALRPVICVAAAAVYYLSGFPTSGNDVILEVVLGGTGLVLGVACAMTTRVWRASDGHSYAKAGGINDQAQRIPLPPGNGGVMGTLLLDGFYRGTWRIARSADRATLRVEPFERFSNAQIEDVNAESLRLLAFATDATTFDVEVAKYER